MTKVALIILGFHRSGTSALAGQINALGFPLGCDATERSEENPNGFFENPVVRSINERALRLLKSAWFDWSLSPSLLVQRAGSTDLDELRIEASAFIQDNFSIHDRLLIKDPRMMRMIWFWEPLFRAAGVSVRHIIIIRPPSECAASQVARAARDPEFYRSITTAEGMNALWCADHLLMLDHLARKQHAVLIVMHRELMNDPEHTLNIIINHLQIEPEPAQYKAALNAIDHTLYRRKDVTAGGPWGTFADEFFLALKGSVERHCLKLQPQLSEFKCVLRRLDTMQSIAAPAADPIHAAAGRERDREVAAGEALVMALKPIELAANRLPIHQLERFVTEIERLVGKTGHRRLFLGPLAAAFVRLDRTEEAKCILEEILDKERHSPWAEKKLKQLLTGVVK